MNRARSRSIERASRRPARRPCRVRRGWRAWGYVERAARGAVDGLLDEAVELVGAELLDHVGDGGLLGGLLVDLAGLLLP